MPASVIAAVPPGCTRASLVCTCVCVPKTAVTFPSSTRARATFSLVASALLGLALLLTQLWFPIRYWDLALQFAAFPSWAVLARDLVLLALLATLLVPTRREPAAARS